MELLESFPTGFEPRVSLEELVEAGLVGVVELVASAQQHEPGAEHFRVKHGGNPVWLSALDVAAHRGQPGGEPSDDVEPVQHMTRLGQTGLHRGFVGFGPVGDDDFDPSTPFVWLRHQKPCQRSRTAVRDHRQGLAGVAVDDDGHVTVAFAHRGLDTDSTRQR